MARFENAVVTSTDVQMPFASFSRSTSTSVFVISTSLAVNRPHFSGKSITLRVSFDGRFARIQSFGMVAACSFLFCTTMSSQWIVAAMFDYRDLVAESLREVDDESSGKVQATLAGFAALSYVGSFYELLLNSGVSEIYRHHSCSVRKLVMT